MGYNMIHYLEAISTLAEGVNTEFHFISLHEGQMDDGKVNINQFSLCESHTRGVGCTPKSHNLMLWDHDHLQWPYYVPLEQQTKGLQYEVYSTATS